MKKSKSGVLIQFIAILLASIFLGYRMWPTYALNLFYKEADALVKERSDSVLKFKFFNVDEGQEVSFTRHLYEGENVRLNGPVLRVRYMKSLPDEVLIEGIDNVPSLWLPMLVQFACLATIIACGREVVKAFRNQAE